MQNQNRGKLTGKVALVTGASKGIGAEIAKRLADEGAAVVVNYASDKAGADRVVAEIGKAGGKAIAVRASVANSAEVAQLFAEAQKAFGRVDVLVNNAGIYNFTPLADFTEADYRKQFDTNVLGVLLASQAAVRQFGPEGGSIINVGSLVSRLHAANASVYSATKSAVDAITRSLAAELGPLKIRVNSVNPGMVETEGTRTAGITESDFRKHVEASTPLGRIGQPQDIAPAVAFLASSEASWISGETLYIAGGMH